MEIISCKAAAALGSAHYYTGKPCKNGHVSIRFVSNRSCVQCRDEYLKKYYVDNRDKYSERDKAYYAENRDSILARQAAFIQKDPDAYRARKRKYNEENPHILKGSQRRHYLKNREDVLKRQREYTKENPDKAVAKRALRRARSRRAIPCWYGELDAFVWLEAADLSRRRRAATGVEWAVDHMIPLVCKIASGLHVAENCQVIPALLNLRKHNKLVLTEPLEWLAHI